MSKRKVKVATFVRGDGTVPKKAQKANIKKVEAALKHQASLDSFTQADWGLYHRKMNERNAEKFKAEKAEKRAGMADTITRFFLEIHAPREALDLITEIVEIGQLARKKLEAKVAALPKVRKLSSDFRVKGGIVVHAKKSRRKK